MKIIFFFYYEESQEVHFYSKKYNCRQCLFRKKVVNGCVSMIICGRKVYKILI